MVARYWDESYLTLKEVLPWFRSPKGKKTKLATNQINFLQKMKDDSELLKMFKKSHGLNDELNPSLHFPRSYFGSVSQHMPVLFAAATINDDKSLIPETINDLITEKAHSKAVNPAVPSIIACLVDNSFGHFIKKSF